SPNGKTGCRPIQMRIDDDQRRRAAEEVLILLEAEFRDETREQYPAIPAARRQMRDTPRGHDRMQDTRGPDVPADRGTQPPKARADRERAGEHDDRPVDR